MAIQSPPASGEGNGSQTTAPTPQPVDRETVVAELRDSQSYVLLTGLGKSLFDFHSAQVREHQEDWRPLLKWLYRAR